MTTREFHHDSLVKDSEITQSPSDFSQQAIAALLSERRASVIGKGANSANLENPLNSNMIDSDPQTQLMLNSGDAWGLPIPLDQLPPQIPYPMDALPEVLRNAVEEAAEITQAPVSMVACSAISVLSIASQAHFDVARTPQLSGPMSLNFLMLAESGERKSTVDKIFSKPVWEYQKQRAIEARKVIAKYKAEMDSWTAQVDAVKGALKKHKLDAQKKAELTEQLKNLYEKEPKRPKIGDTLFHDVTIEKLLHHLAHDWPSVGIMSAEGAIFFGGRSMSNDNQLSALGVYNSLWSGESVKSDRKISSSAHVDNARLSMSLMVQPAVFKEYFSESPVLREIGFAARCFFCFPPSTQGTRLFKPHKTETKRIDAYHQLVQQLLSMAPNFKEDSLCPIKLGLTVEAQQIWISFFNEIEVQQGKGSEYSDIRDFASKIAEIAARLAGSFQVSKGMPVLEIDADSMTRSIEIARWHLNEAKRYFGIVSEKPLKNAQALSDWLIKKAHTEDKDPFSRTHIMQYGPSAVRCAKELDSALKILTKYHHISLEDKGRIILLNPNLLNQDYPSH
jgi:putative DNA primase/helicase